MLCLQRINWAILLRRDCHGSELPANVEFTIPRLNDLFENENEVYFQQDRVPLHFHVNVRNFLDQIQLEIDRTKRKWYGVPASRLLPLGNFKEHGVRHKTTNTGGTERSD